MLRPLRREDIDIEAAFLTGLSPESRHNRLLGGMIQISRAYVEQLTTVDYTRDMALAAVLMLEDREVLIGVALPRRPDHHPGDAGARRRETARPLAPSPPRSPASP